jgi:hypothetical protein
MGATIAANAVNKTPKRGTVLAAAALIIAGFGYLVADYVAFRADPNPPGTPSLPQAVLKPASALAIMVGRCLLVAIATREFGRRPQILFGITVALVVPWFVIAPLASYTQAWWLFLVYAPVGVATGVALRIRTNFRSVGTALSVTTIVLCLTLLALGPL